VALPSDPTLTLNNGVELAAIGYGVFQTPPDETPCEPHGGGELRVDGRRRTRTRLERCRGRAGV